MKAVTPHHKLEAEVIALRARVVELESEFSTLLEASNKLLFERDEAKHALYTSHGYGKMLLDGSEDTTAPDTFQNFDKVELTENWAPLAKGTQGVVFWSLDVLFVSFPTIKRWQNVHPVTDKQIIDCIKRISDQHAPVLADVPEVRYTWCNRCSSDYCDCNAQDTGECPRCNNRGYVSIQIPRNGVANITCPECKGKVIDSE